MDEQLPPDWGLDESFRQFLLDYPCEGNGQDLSANQGDSNKQNTIQRSIGAEGFVYATDLYSLTPDYEGLLQPPTNAFELTQCRNPYMSPYAESQLLPQAPLSTEHSPPQQQEHRNLEHSANGEFQFESRAVVIEDRSKPTNGHKAPIDNGLKCEHPGCKSRRTFKRKYELQRHMKKHTESSKYKCPVLNCERVFYRPDKLQLHLRQGHFDEDEVSCPIGSCLAGTIPLALIGIHTRNHMWNYNSVVQNVLSKNYISYNCPIPSCGYSESRRQDRVQTHLQSHTLGQRKESEQQIQQSGYDPITVETVCPVCKERFANSTNFVPHCLKAHVINDPTHLQEIHGVFDGEWDVPWSEYAYRKCFICYKGQDVSSLGRPQRHWAILQDLESLRPYRLSILKLWRQFGSHPVFDDIRPTVERDYVSY